MMKKDIEAADWQGIVMGEIPADKQASEQGCQETNRSVCIISGLFIYSPFFLAVCSKFVCQSQKVTILSI